MEKHENIHPYSDTSIESIAFLESSTLDQVSHAHMKTEA